MSTDTVVHAPSGFTEADMYRLRELIAEFDAAGRTDDAGVLARAHALASGVLYADMFAEIETAPDLLTALEEADRDYEEGRTIPHEEVMRSLRAHNHA